MAATSTPANTCAQAAIRIALCTMAPWAGLSILIWAYFARSEHLTSAWFQESLR
jgi:hypothetical protein